MARRPDEYLTHRLHEQEVHLMRDGDSDDEDYQDEEDYNDEDVDESSEESFPASDPPSWTPGV